MRRVAFAGAGLLILVFLAGCAEMNPFGAPGEVMRHPLGTETIKIGMSKQEVVSKWSEPDIVNAFAITDTTGTVKEEWIYKARRYSPTPLLNTSYLSQNKYLYFEGKTLTRISDTSQASGE